MSSIMWACKEHCVLECLTNADSSNRGHDLAWRQLSRSSLATLCKSWPGTSECLQLILWFLLLQEMLQLMSGRQRQLHLSADSGGRTVEATAGGSAAGSSSVVAQVPPQPWANPRSLASAAAEALLDAAEGSGSVTKRMLQQSGAQEAGPGSGAQIGHGQSTESQGSSALAEGVLQPGGGK